VKLYRLPVCWLFVCLMAHGAAITAEQLFKDAQKAERAGQTSRAYVLYSEAAAADPTNVTYWERSQALRPMAMLMKDAERPAKELPSDKIDSTLFGSIAGRDLDQARKPLPPPHLKAKPGVQDYDLKGDSKALWEQVAKTLDLAVIFDTQYQPTGTVRFQLDGADYRNALNGLQMATNSYLTPVGERLIFVANDSPQKRTEFEGNTAVVIPFPETITVQELQEVATGVRGTLDMQKLMVDTQRHLILLKDRTTKVLLAEKIFQDLLRPHAQVAVDVRCSLYRTIDPPPR